MATSDTPRPDPDALARRLQASLQQRRFRPWRIVGLVLLLALAALAAVAWSLYTDRPDTVPLQVLALDTVVNESQTPHARAVLMVPGGEARAGAGYDIVFVDMAGTFRPGQGPRQEKTHTDRHGGAEVDWPSPAGTAEADFMVRYINVRQRHGTSDRGHIFVWPKRSAVLLVEVNDLLSAPAPAAGGALPMQVPPLRPDAVLALHELRDELHVVYLSPDVAAWLPARQLRLGVEARWLGRPGLPPGPVWGQVDFPAGAAVRAQALQTLRHDFAGPIVALVRQASLVPVYQGLHAEVVWLGAEPPAPLPQADTWASVPGVVRQALEKK